MISASVDAPKKSIKMIRFMILAAYIMATDAVSSSLQLDSKPMIVNFIVLFTYCFLYKLERQSRTQGKKYYCMHAPLKLHYIFIFIHNIARVYIIMGYANQSLIQHIATVTVNGTIAGTRDNPSKFNVKEDAGKIVLCFTISIRRQRGFMAGRCRTVDGTAGNLCKHNG